MSKRENSDIKFFDIHSHLLPGVDDGSQSLEDTMHSLEMLKDIGVSDIVLTPHYSVHKEFTVAQNDIQSRFDKISESLRHSFDLNVYLGREIEISYDTLELLREKKLGTYMNTDKILIEFPYTISIRDMLSAVRDTVAMGYTPIIAHLERYACIYDDMDMTADLKAAGAYIQMNVTSFLSKNRALKGLCKRLVKLRIPDYMGTDTHNKVPTKAEFEKVLKKIINLTDIDYTRDIFYGNAHRKLRGD